MAFTDNPGLTITAATEYLVGKTVDTILNYSPVTLFFLANQKPWRGVAMRIPVKYQSNSKGVSFNGLDKFSTEVSSNFINMSFDPTGREIPVVVPQMDVDVAESNRSINIVARQLASDAQDMDSDIATRFWTLQTGKHFLSILDGVDDGDLGATTYGGLTRATYSSLNGTVTTSVGNLTLANMGTAFNAAVHGSEKPNLMVADKTAWNYYEALLTPTLSTQVTQNTLLGYSMFTGAAPNGFPNIVAPGSNLKGAQGFSAISYRGAWVVADENITAGYLAYLNTNAWAFYGLPSKDERAKPIRFNSDTIEHGVYNIPVTNGFSWLDFQRPLDQYGKVGHIILMGNLICRNPRLNSLQTGITGS